LLSSRTEAAVGPQTTVVSVILRTTKWAPFSRWPRSRGSRRRRTRNVVVRMLCRRRE
jgi:hypothetical protein